MQINDLVPCSHLLQDKRQGRRRVKFRFYAPSDPGTYIFSAVVTCDSYLGIDLRREVKLVIKPFEEAEETKREAEEEEAWKDFEEEDRLEREMMTSAAQDFGFLAGGSRPADDESSSDDSSDDSDDSD